MFDMSPLHASSYLILITNHNASYREGESLRKVICLKSYQQWHQNSGLQSPSLCADCERAGSHLLHCERAGTYLLRKPSGLSQQEHILL